jgi:hypothetical protein
VVEEEAQAEGHEEVDDARDGVVPDGDAQAGGGVEADEPPEQRAALLVPCPRDERSQPQACCDQAVQQVGAHAQVQRVGWTGPVPGRRRRRRGNSRRWRRRRLGSRHGEGGYCDEQGHDKLGCCHYIVAPIACCYGSIVDVFLGWFPRSCAWGGIYRSRRPDLACSRSRLSVHVRDAFVRLVWRPPVWAAELLISLLPPAKPVFNGRL